MTIEEALDTLTHRCRFRPALKLRPNACDARRAKKQKIADEKSFSTYWECAQCEGPVPREPEDGDRPESMTADSGKSTVARRGAKPSRERKPGKKAGGKGPTLDSKSVGPCNLCGKGPEETDFYPSRPERCISCIKKRKKELRHGGPVGKREEEPLSVTAVQVEHPMDARPMTSPESGHPDRGAESSGHLYLCENHGPHSGRIFGRAHSKTCPSCYREKMKAQLEASRKTKTSETPGGDIPQWIADWCAEQAVLHQVSPREYLIGQIAREIPADWLKEWMVRFSARIEMKK